MPALHTMGSRTSASGGPTATPAGRSVYVYNGPGAGARCALSAFDTLASTLRGCVQVRWLNPDALLDGAWQQDCALLCMPGGADLPYCRLLNGKGNALICEYVHAGGSYLGLCAGAYYAAARVEFEAGHSQLEVVGDRELAFWPGIARGAAYTGFDYASERGAVAAGVSFLPTFHHVPVQGDNCPAGLLPSMIPAAANVAAQSTGPSAQWLRCVDYSNGGPVFVWAGAAAAQEPAFQPLPTVAESCIPRTGDLFAPLLEVPASCTVLGTYTDVGPGGVAAVRCEVGAGVAVLCGTHPELTASWLLDDGGEAAGGGDDVDLAAHRKALADQLMACTHRAAFWRLILAACCVGFTPGHATA